MAVRPESLENHGDTPSLRMMEAAPSFENTKHPREEGVLLGSEHNPTYLITDRVISGAGPVEWTLEIPENLAYDGVVHFINGFGATKESSRPFRKAAAQAGYATVTCETARKDGQPVTARAFHPQALHLDTIYAVSQGMRAHRDGIRKNVPNGKTIDLDRKFLAPHSMGGLSATNFASKEPDSVDIIMNLATVGYGTTTLRNIARNLPNGLLPALKHEIIPAMQNGDLEVSPKHFWSEIKYFLTDTTRPVFEGLSCLRTDVRTEVAVLRSLGKGVLYLAFDHDILVAPDPSVADYVDIHKIMPNAGHLAPQRKAGKVMEEVVALHNQYKAMLG